jgi:hypothetical protein
MSSDNEIRLTEQIEASTIDMEKRENFMADHINSEAYSKRAYDMNRGLEIGMYANW